MRRAPLSIGLLATLAAALPACNGCHSSKPYTPYTITDPPSASASASARPAGSAAPDGDAGPEAPSFAPVAATPAPGDGKSWPLEGGAAPVPSGHVFTEGLVFDADDDG